MCTSPIACVLRTRNIIMSAVPVRVRHWKVHAVASSTRRRCHCGTCLIFIGRLYAWYARSRENNCKKKNNYSIFNLEQFEYRRRDDGWNERPLVALTKYPPPSPTYSRRMAAQLRFVVYLHCTLAYPLPVQLLNCPFCPTILPDRTEHVGKLCLISS